MKPIKRLQNLTAHEVSLVKRGANKRPFLIYKNAEGTPLSDSTQETGHSEKSVADLLQLTPDNEAKIDAFVRKVCGRVQKDGQNEPMDARQQAALKAVYRILLPFKDTIGADDLYELVDEIGLRGEDTDSFGEADTPEDSEAYEDDADLADNSTSDVEAADSGDTMKDLLQKADDDKKWAMPKADGVDDKAHAMGVAAAKAAYKKAACGGDKADKADKAPKADEDWADEDKNNREENKKGKSVSKSADFNEAEALASLPKETRAYFEMIRKRDDEDKKAWIAKSATLEAEVREMKEEKIQKSYEAQIREEFPHLSLDAQKTARVMKSLAAVSEDTLADYLSTLRAQNEQIRANQALGKGGLYGSASGVQKSAHSQMSNNLSAEDRLQSMVHEYISKSATPMSEAEGYAAVVKTPAGLDAYVESVNAKGDR